MSILSIASRFFTQQAHGVSAAGPQKVEKESGTGAGVQDRFGGAYQVDLSPKAQAMMANGGGVVQALMTNSLTGVDDGSVNYGGTFKTGLFSIADANHDGVMVRDELVRQAVAGGASQSDADAMFAVNDRNRNGEVTAQEFFETMATPVDDDTFGGQIGRMMDGNGDGTVTAAEIEKLLEKSGRSNDRA